MIERIKKHKEKLNKLQGEKQLLKKQYKSKNTDLKQIQIDYENLLQAQVVIQDVVQETQSKLKIHITDLVNLAIDSIPFPKRPDFFDLEFVVRRNQTETNMYVIEKGRKGILPFSQGGGVNDIISFGLRLACFSLVKGNKSNTIILDEPFKNLNDPNSEYKLKEHMANMIKKISEKLHIQFVIVGNNNDFIDIADRGFKVFLNEKDHSELKVIKENN